MNRMGYNLLTMHHDMDHRKLVCRRCGVHASFASISPCVRPENEKGDAAQTD